MEQALTVFISEMDQIRTRVLRWSLPVPWLRSLFMNRAMRLQVLFLAAASIYLFLSLFFPLWVLVIGPMIWGVPHIFASIRYIPHALSKNTARFPSVTKALFALWGLVTILRVLSDQFQITLGWSASLPSNWPEMGAAVLTIFALFYLARQKFSRSVLGVVLLAPVIFFSWTSPWVTAGVLIILHNWIAFIYWFKSCKTLTERKVVMFSLAVFASIHALILAGSFDFLYHFYSPQGFHVWAQLDFSDLGRMIAPNSTDPTLWFHLVSIYAFGQSLHYFIWLKAIPEQELPREFPVSFGLSLKYLTADFGRKTLRWIPLVLVAGILAWILLKLPQARSLYFSVAAFHGYMEIAGLGFLQFDKINSQPDRSFAA